MVPQDELDQGREAEARARRESPEDSAPLGCCESHAAKSELRIFSRGFWAGAGVLAIVDSLDALIVACVVPRQKLEHIFVCLSDCCLHDSSHGGQTGFYCGMTDMATPR